MKTIPNTSLLTVAREAIELVIVRTQIEVATNGMQPYLLDRIASLSDALDLLDDAAKVTSLVELV